MGTCGSTAKVQQGVIVTNKVTEDEFQIQKTLGMGASCKVVMAEYKKGKSTKGKKVALKILNKTGENDILFGNEWRIMSSLNHPNIVKFIEAFEDKTTYNIVSDLCVGGELFDRVQGGSFSEKDASDLTKQMLVSLKHCHDRGVVHRDLKPENYVFANTQPSSPMQLIDFGCAVQAKDDGVIKDVAGSPYYVAPEVLVQTDLKGRPIIRTCKMWKGSDMWSIGVIIFLLVHGYPPFNGQEQDAIFRRIVRGKYRFSKEVQLSSEVKDLIKKLLVKDPFKRLTVDEALAHPWIASNVAPRSALPSFVVNSLGVFRSQCRLKKAVARAMLKTMTEQDQNALEAAFNKYDLNGDGLLSPNEIVEMMKSIGRNAEDAKELMANIDENNDGYICKEEFATLQALEKLESMDEAAQDEFYAQQFRKFDLDGDGEVTHKEIENVCTNMTKEAVQELISQVDKDNDGAISFHEWMDAMKDMRQNTLKPTSLAHVEE